MVQFCFRDFIIYQLRQEIAQLKLALERQEQEVSSFWSNRITVISDLHVQAMKEKNSEKDFLWTLILSSGL